MLWGTRSMATKEFVLLDLLVRECDSYLPLAPVSSAFMTSCRRSIVKMLWDASTQPSAGFMGEVLQISLHSHQAAILQNVIARRRAWSHGTLHFLQIYSLTSL